MKKSNFNIIYFLIIFFVLYYGFYVYVGLSTPGGKIYIPFLYHYLNVPYWLTKIVVGATKFLLEAMGYPTYQKTSVNVTIKGSRGVNVAWPCLGVGVITAWIAFIVAHRDKPAHKLRWILGGILLIFFINIVRIVFIELSLHYNWKYTQAMSAHTLFNTLTYIIIILLMVIFVLFYNRKLQHNQNYNVPF